MKEKWLKKANTKKKRSKLANMMKMGKGKSMKAAKMCEFVPN